MATVAEVVAFSGLTSVVIDTRDAFDISYSIYTSAGTSTGFNYQVSNWTGRIGLHGNPPEASWSIWTSFTPSLATDVHPVLGPRYARWFKDGATGTFVVSYSKTLQLGL